ncbi:glucuronyl hydrolase [Alcaligenes faecalis]|uniref:glucuronyl hydrolase n=1 Tax=Alcaligenes faecalis TaxID=511 RepID=UPI000F0BBD22|nr:glucuronyl hydrolase [Alcaligenes faecalis]AYR19187.1 glucuronyl hydrolase [Alcaligenes faecalis]
MSVDVLGSVSIQAIFANMDQVAEQCGEQFPLFRPSSSEQWTLSRRGSWLGGFWAGLWWRRALISGQEQDKRQALHWSQKLQVWLQEPSINRSFVFWYGAGLGSIWHGNRQAEANVDLAAQALLNSFDASSGFWPLGSGMGGGESGNHMLNVDALAPTLLVLNAQGGPVARQFGQWHVDACLRYLQKRSGAWRDTVLLRGNDVLAEQGTQTWQRGQAWAMLGMASATRLYDRASYAHAALKACRYWHERWGKYAHGFLRQDSPLSPVDRSAWAIASLAMYELWQILPEQQWLHEQSRLYLDALLTPELSETGRFVGHLYKVAPGQSELVESACASFFLLEALLAHLA